MRANEWKCSGKSDNEGNKRKAWESASRYFLKCRNTGPIKAQASQQQLFLVIFNDCLHIYSFNYNSFHIIY